jgi:hypothetical protein
MATTWNPSDKSASTTLSSGNLVASFASGNNGVRSTDRIYTGKYYWEVTFTGTVVNLAVGVALGTSSLTTAVGGNITCYVSSNGGISINGSATGTTIGAVANGGVVCYALDAANDLIWYRNGAAGNWNGNVANNPATGVGGISIASWAGGLMGIYAWAFGGAGSCGATANFGASAFAGAVPSGFTPEFPGGTTLINTAVVTQTSLEQWGQGAPVAQITQVALEQWGALAFAAGRAVITQVALEQWAFALETTTIGATRYSDPDSIYQATIKLLRTNLVASRYIDPDRFYQADISRVIPSNLVYSYRVLQN